MFVIKSGSDGNTAKVNELGELSTFAVTEDVTIRKALSAEAYLIGTPIINLTTDTISYVIYVFNSDLVPWIITKIFPRYGESVGGGGLDFKSSTIFNPTGGTLLSSGTDFFAANLDLANQVPLQGIFKYGAQGLIAVGNNPAAETLIPAARPFENPVPIILRPGSSFAVGVTPPTGNTSLNVQFNYELLRGQ